MATSIEPLVLNRSGLKQEGKSQRTLFGGGICLRSGRNALKGIAREFAYATVLLPALSCDSMTIPFELYHYDVCLLSSKL